MRKFLCFIGLHKWTYRWDGERRSCDCCPRREKAVIDEMHNTCDWVRDE